MKLLAGVFCGDAHRFDTTPTNVSNINNIKLRNGIYDELFGSRNTKFTYAESVKIWDFDTAFFALFQGDLFGGNVNFTSDTVSAMRIKRRKKGTYKWDTLFEIPIEKNEDFAFERFDRYARGNTEYEYSLVPVINNVEGNLNTNSVKSEFDGFYFIEKDVVFRAFVNLQLSHQRNQMGNTISTLGSKYPFYITNGANSYDSGQLTATFFDIGLDNEITEENAWQFRQAVDDFLSNGNPKILKNDEGKMWMIAIVDNIPQDFSQHWNMPIHTITWTEIGDCENVDDLYDNNFIDIDSRLIRW